MFWLDRELLHRELVSSAAALSRNHPNVREVILFGSAAQGRATAHSDVDIAIIVDGTERRFIDRPAEFTRHFSHIGMGVDVFVYTEEEIQAGMGAGPGALARGTILFRRKGERRQ
ncbi:MAG: nucleotidyltransferase domain-containing protein [bacterium]|nr:nucleotidyltransferase domain-containing protein [bacterium]